MCELMLSFEKIDYANIYFVNCVYITVCNKISFRWTSAFPMLIIIKTLYIHAGMRLRTYVICAHRAGIRNVQICIEKCI